MTYWIFEDRGRKDGTSSGDLRSGADIEEIVQRRSACSEKNSNRIEVMSRMTLPLCTPMLQKVRQICSTSSATRANYRITGPSKLNDGTEDIG